MTIYPIGELKKVLNSLRSNTSIFDVILSVAKILIYGEIDIQNEHKTEIPLLFFNFKKASRHPLCVIRLFLLIVPEQNIWPALFPPL